MMLRTMTRDRFIVAGMIHSSTSGATDKDGSLMAAAKGSVTTITAWLYHMLLSNGIATVLYLPGQRSI